MDNGAFHHERRGRNAFYVNLLDLFKELDRSERIQTIRKDGKNIEINLDLVLSDSIKMHISRILDLAEYTFNGIRTPRRSISEYNSEPWVNIQIEKYVIGLIQKRSSNS